MACRLDIKNKILDKVNEVFIEGRYTYYRVNDDTFRVANVRETRGKSKAKSLDQAREIATEVKDRIVAKYGNNVFVEVILPQYIGFPVEIKVTPSQLYIERLFANVPAEKRTEPISRLAFLQDPALYQQELAEDQVLKSIPYETWLAQNKPYTPIVGENGQIQFFPLIPETGFSDLQRHKKAVEDKIKQDLPTEVADTIQVLDVVPPDVLGARDLYFSMKEILEEVGIVDPLLVNWLGINKQGFKNFRSIRSQQQLEEIIKSIYEKRLKTDSPEFKKNELLKRSFDNWAQSLEKYPLAFRDLMLKHAIKHLINPERRSKYILELSSVALQQVYGMVMNKPYELNRVGKLYDQEVLKTTSDAVDHEPSASGKGYWVYIPRTQNSKHSIELQKRINERIDKQINAINLNYEVIYSKGNSIYDDVYIRGEEYPLGFKIEDAKYTKGKFDKEKTLEYLKAEKEENNKVDNTQYKTNVELLRKLSPSTWCTASSMTEYYVQNYDNYLLIVDGVTVAGIEAYPPAIEDRETLLRKLNKIESSIQNGVAGPDEYNRRDEIERLLSGEIPEIKVKEVTSRANNGIAPIDHIDDILAFFKKHNLDTDNNSVQKAIRAKESGKTDVDMGIYEGADAEELEWAALQREAEAAERLAIDMHNGEYEPDGGEYWDYQEEQAQARERYEMLELEAIERAEAIETVEDALTYVRESEVMVFQSLKPELRANREVAELATLRNGHNIAFIDSTLPFYSNLAHQVLSQSPHLFLYLSEEARQEQRNIDIHNAWWMAIREEDDLPFSKTKDRQIQGYYDAKTDKVVVIASNIRVNEAAKVGIHEVAHRGMLRMAKELGGTQELYEALSAAKSQLMSKLPELLKRTGHKNLESLMLDYGFNPKSQEGEIKLLMELAARWAETLVNKPKPSWWKKLLQNIGQWVKQFTGITLTENQVDELVGGFVQYGTTQEKLTLQEELALSKTAPSTIKRGAPITTDITEIPDVMAAMIYQNNNCK